jgi:hypothetical protein
MLRFLVKGAFLAALLYTGTILGFPYFQYVMMQRAVEEAADVGVAELKARRKGPWRDDAVLGEVTTAVTTLMQAQAKRVGLDLPPKGVWVLLEPEFFRVGTNWQAEARFPGYSHRFHFRVEGKRFTGR